MLLLINIYFYSSKVDCSSFESLDYLERTMQKNEKKNILYKRTSKHDIILENKKRKNKSSKEIINTNDIFPNNMKSRQNIVPFTFTDTNIKRKNMIRHRYIKALTLTYEEKNKLNKSPNNSLKIVKNPSSYLSDSVSKRDIKNSNKKKSALLQGKGINIKSFYSNNIQGRNQLSYYFDTTSNILQPYKRNPLEPNSRSTRTSQMFTLTQTHSTGQNSENIFLHSKMNKNKTTNNSISSNNNNGNILSYKKENLMPVIATYQNKQIKTSEGLRENNNNASETTFYSQKNSSSPAVQNHMTNNNSGPDNLAEIKDYNSNLFDAKKNARKRALQRQLSKISEIAHVPTTNSNHNFLENSCIINKHKSTRNKVSSKNGFNNILLYFDSDHKNFLDINEKKAISTRENYKKKKSTKLRIKDLNMNEHISKLANNKKKIRRVPRLGSTITDKKLKSFNSSGLCRRKSFILLSERFRVILNSNEKMSKYSNKNKIDKFLMTLNNEINDYYINGCNKKNENEKKEKLAISTTCMNEKIKKLIKNENEKEDLFKSKTNKKKILNEIKKNYLTSCLDSNKKDKYLIKKFLFNNIYNINYRTIYNKQYNELLRMSYLTLIGEKYFHQGSGANTNVYEDKDKNDISKLSREAKIKIFTSKKSKTKVFTIKDRKAFLNERNDKNLNPFDTFLNNNLKSKLHNDNNNYLSKSLSKCTIKDKKIIAGFYFNDINLTTPDKNKKLNKSNEKSNNTIKRFSLDNENNNNNNSEFSYNNLQLQPKRIKSNKNLFKNESIKERYNNESQQSSKKLLAKNTVSLEKKYKGISFMSIMRENKKKVNKMTNNYKNKYNEKFDKKTNKIKSLQKTFSKKKSVLTYNLLFDPNLCGYNNVDNEPGKETKKNKEENNKLLNLIQMSSGGLKLGKNMYVMKTLELKNKYNDSNRGMGNIECLLNSIKNCDYNSFKEFYYACKLGPNAMDKDGNTLLSLAVKSSCLEIVNFLLEEKANPNLGNVSNILLIIIFILI